MEGVHPILAAVLQRTEKSLWPSEFHLGAAPPQVTRHVVLPLAVLVLELLSEVDGSDVAKDAAHLCRAVASAQDPGSRFTSSRDLWEFALHHDLRGPDFWDRLGPAPQLVARSVWIVTRHDDPPPQPPLALHSEEAQWTLDNFTRVLQSFVISAGRRRRLLHDIDRALVVDEAVCASSRGGRIDVQEVLWRKPSQTHDGVHLVCELSDGSHLAVTWLSGDWRVEHGPLDDVLSVLPEDLLAEAADRVLPSR